MVIRTSLCEIRDFSAVILGEQKANCQALFSTHLQTLLGGGQLLFGFVAQRDRWVIRDK
jgi:hypothetical protein